MTKNISAKNPLTLRMPDELHDEITSSAAKNKRSANSELLFRIEAGYRPLPEYSTMDLLEIIMARCEPGEFAFRLGHIRKINPK